MYPSDSKRLVYQSWRHQNGLLNWTVKPKRIDNNVTVNLLPVWYSTNKRCCQRKSEIFEPDTNATDPNRQSADRTIRFKSAEYRFFLFVNYNFCSTVCKGKLHSKNVDVHIWLSLLYNRLFWMFIRGRILVRNALNSADTIDVGEVTALELIHRFSSLSFIVACA